MTNSHQNQKAWGWGCGSRPGEGVGKEVAGLND